MKAIVKTSVMPSSPTATQSFTDSVFSSDAKAAIFFASRGTSSDAIANEAMLSIGFTDGTNQAAWSFHDRNGQTSTDIRTEMSTAHSISFADGQSNNSLAEATGSLVATGAQLSWTDWNNSELISGFVIGGSDVEASVVTATLNGTTDVTVNHNLSGTPTAIIAISSGLSASGNGTACKSLGFYSVADDTYRCASQRQASGVATTVLGQMWLTNAIAVEHDNSALVWSATLNDVGASSFDVVAGGAGAAGVTDVIYFLCIRITNGYAQVGDFTTQTSVTTHGDISSMAAAPTAVLYITTNLGQVQAAADLSLSGFCENLGFGAAALNGVSTEIASVNMFSDDAVTTTKTRSLSSNTGIVGMTNTGAGIEYAFGVDSWTTGGVVHNYTDVDTTARRVLYLALAAPSGRDPIRLKWRM